MNIPKVKHSGNWIIDKENDLSVLCYVMDNNERVLSLRGTSRAMGLVGGGSTALVRNLGAKWISPYLSDKLKEWLSLALRNELPDYINESNRAFTPFNAELFIDLCKAYVDAMRDGVLETDIQKKVADRLYITMTAFAKVGLISIIDEVTGFQYEREKDALQKMYKMFFSEDLIPWQQKFPHLFYKELFRLNDWEWTEENMKKKPGVIGKWTNKLIYEQMPAGILEELRKRNPKNEKGYTKNKDFQHLSMDVGHPTLSRLLQQSLTLFALSDNMKQMWWQFEKLVAHQKGYEQLGLDLPPIEPPYAFDEKGYTIAPDE